MNKPFRTSGKTTTTTATFAIFVTVLVFWCSVISCAVTPTTSSSLDPTSTTSGRTTNGTSSVNLVTTSVLPETSSQPAPTNSVQDVSETSVPSVSTTTSQSSLVTDQPPSSSTTSIQPIPTPTSSSESTTPVVSTVPSVSTTVSAVPAGSSTTQQSVSSSTQSPSSTTSTQSAPASTQAPVSSTQSISTQSVPSATAVPASTSPTTTTTLTPKPLISAGGVNIISLDPSAGIVISEPNLEDLASNGSKLIIKYVAKGQDALSKQTQKFVFKSDPSGSGNASKFVAKYLVKNASVVEKKKNQFTDFMPEHIRNNGGVIVHVLLLVYVCLSLGIICDLYFLTSIEYIGNKLQLPADIAGATFMALGTSAPELFIAMIGVFIAEDDIGTSTILGSAVFNLIFVPGVCGFAIYFSRIKYPKINKYSILRDAIFYMIAITTLLLILKDNEIDWIESLCMLSLYCIYITILYFNAQLGEIEFEDEDEESDTESGSNETSPLLQSQNSTTAFTKSEKHMLTKSADWLENGGAGRLGTRARKGSVLNHVMMRSNSIRTSSIRNGSMLGLPNGTNGYIPIDTKTAKLAIQEEPCGMPENWAESHWLLSILMFPVVLLIKLTVPKPNKHNYFLTFIISILWISGFTYLSVWLVTIIGYALNLPETVLGLTILAAGASIPEVISSVIVVKRAGLANMALCNLFGSNIFDILVCLGLPWLIKNVITMVNLGTTDLLLTVVSVQSHGLLLTTFTLLICVVSFVFTLSYFDWKFGLGVGIVYVVIYFIAITLAASYELLLN